MADAQTPAARLDVDILADIQRWMLNYPPLANDRRHIQITVDAGRVTLRGNIKTPITRDYLQNNIRNVAGVTEIDVAALHDDDTIRIALGNVLPPGVIANPEWGVVILGGTVPAGEEQDALIHKVAQISGVHKVVVPA